MKRSNTLETSGVALERPPPRPRPSPAIATVRACGHPPLPPPPRGWASVSRLGDVPQRQGLVHGFRLEGATAGPHGLVIREEPAGV